MFIIRIVAVALLGCFWMVGCSGDDESDSRVLKLEIEGLSNAADKYVQSRLADVRPQAIDLGDHQLLCMPNGSLSGGYLSVTFLFYEYQDGKLVEVPLKDEP